MSGLLALLDDVVALAKVAAVTVDDAAAQAVKVGSKTAGVVIDDAAVTPRYVTGLAAQRELPIIGRIALGSLRKVLHWITGTPVPTIADAAAAGIDAKALEEQRVTGAIRTDFILSAEIMAIALANTTAPDLATKGLVLAVVALLVTAGVYGAVALIVKADDLGVALARRGGPVSGPLGRALVFGMPPFLQVLSVVGTLAMLWVGGGILVHGLQEYGISEPEHWIHGFAAAVRAAVPAANDVLAWIASAFGAAVVGIAAGAVTAVLLKIVTFPFAKAEA